MTKKLADMNCSLIIKKIGKNRNKNKKMDIDIFTFIPDYTQKSKPTLEMGKSL